MSAALMRDIMIEVLNTVSTDILDGTELFLVTNDPFLPNSNTTYEDLSIVDTDWAAAQPVVVNDIASADGDSLKLRIEEVTFNYDPDEVDVTPVTVTGYGVRTISTTDLVLCGPLPASKYMSDALSQVSVNAELVVPAIDASLDA